MGKELKKYFEKANQIGGVKAQMRLSLITKMSIIKANNEPDTPENIRKFEEALKEIQKEISST